MRCKDGSYKWILCRGTVVERDSAGAPVRMIGIHSDISERKRAEEALLVFRRLVETTNQAIRVADAAGRIQYVNPAYEQLLGYTLAEVADKPFTQTGIVSEEQALVQTDLLGHDFYVFENATTGLINVVYHRKNGGYGIIKPRIETLDE